MTTPHKETLQQHFDLCEEAYALMLEENGILKKKEPMLPSDAFLEKKRNLLNRLEESTKQLKAINKEGQPLSDTSRDLAQQSLNRMMKIFFLDRENEQLLLKVSMQVAESNPQTKPVTTAQLKKLYTPLSQKSPVPKTEEVLSPNAPSSLFQAHEE